MEFRFVYGDRGGKLLSCQNQKYYKDHVSKNNIITWRCVRRTCKAKIYTIGDSLNVNNMTSFINHNHELHENIQHPEEINSLKRKATSPGFLTEKPMKLIKKMENDDDKEDITEQDVTRIRRHMYRTRRSYQPTKKKRVEEVLNKTINLNEFLNDDEPEINEETTSNNDTINEDISDETKQYLIQTEEEVPYEQKTDLIETEEEIPYDQKLIPKIDLIEPEEEFPHEQPIIPKNDLIEIKEEFSYDEKSDIIETDENYHQNETDEIKQRMQENNKEKEQIQVFGKFVMSQMQMITNHELMNNLKYTIQNAIIDTQMKQIELDEKEYITD